jgi:hypothetical protein
MTGSNYGGKRAGAGRPKGKKGAGRIIGVSPAELVQVEAGLASVDKRQLAEARLGKFFRKSCTPSRRRVRAMVKYIETTERRVIDALGGPEVITPQKEIILKAAMWALQVAIIVELYINQEGPIRKDLLERGIVDLQPALEKIVSFYNAARLNLVAIGLEARRADAETRVGQKTATARNVLLPPRADEIQVIYASVE